MVDILEETTVFHKLSYNRGKKPMKFTFPPESKPLEGYTIKRAVGRGGFGEVYYALSDAGKEVALKLLLHNMDVELRGVTQCLNLKHPNLVTIFDIKQDSDGDHWIVMEYVSGKSLDDVLDKANGPLPFNEIQYWLTGMVSGLAFLHDRGIVHRDLKPANVYNENEIVKIGDIGLAKYISQSRRNAQTESVGTVYYMAPEVAHGKYGHEVDIYSLGIVLYEMLTGKLPFDGESTGEILMKHLTEKPDLSIVPSQFHSVISRALEKDPQKRTPSMIQLGKEVQLAIDGKPLAFEVPDKPAPIPEKVNRTTDTNGTPVEGVPKLKHHAKEFGKEAEKYARKYSREAQDYARKVAKNAQEYAHKQKQAHDEWVKGHGQAKSAPEHFSPHNMNNYKPVKRSFLQDRPLVKTILVVLGILFLFAAMGSRPAQRMFESSIVICIFGGMFYGALKFFGWLLGWNYHTKENRHYNNPYSPPEVSSPADLKYDTPYAIHPETPLEVPEVKHKKKKGFKRKRKFIYYGPDTLRLIPAVEKTNSIIYSLLYSMIFATVISFCLYATEFLSHNYLVAIAFGITTILASWAIMIPAKIWEGKEVDSTTKRIFQMSLGGIVGAVAYYLHRFLDVNIHSSFFKIDVPRLHQIGDFHLSEYHSPTLIAFVLFFAGLFFIQRWWLQADSFRKKRFRIRTVLGTLFFALIASGLTVSTCSIAITWMVTTSCIVQLSSEWVPRSRREHIVNKHQPKPIS